MVVSQALGSSPLLSSSICLAQGFSLRQAQPFCCEAQEGILSCWVGIQSSQALSLTGALRAGQNASMVCPAQTARPKETLHLTFLRSPGAMHAWVEEVFTRPYSQITQFQSHRLCLPKHSPAQPPEGENLASLRFFPSKGLWGQGRGRLG